MASVSEAPAAGPLPAPPEAQVPATVTHETVGIADGPGVANRGQALGNGDLSAEAVRFAPRSPPWFSGLVWASPSSQRTSSFFRTPEMLIFAAGLASLLSFIVLLRDLLDERSVKPVPMMIFVAAGAYAVFLIRRQRSLAEAEQALLIEIMEGRAGDPSRRVITKEERRAVLTYFTFRPSGEFKRSTVESARPSGESKRPSEETTRPYLPHREDASLSSSLPGDGSRQARPHLLSSRPPVRDLEDEPSATVANSGGGGGSGTTEGFTCDSCGVISTGTMTSVVAVASTVEARAGSTAADGSCSDSVGAAPGEMLQAEDATGMGEAGKTGVDLDRTGAANECVTVCVTSDPQAAVGVQDEAGVGTAGGEESARAGCEDQDSATTCKCSESCRRGCLDACPGHDQKGMEGKETSTKGARRGNSWNWSTAGTCIVCFGEYAYGDDLCRLPCRHIYHAKCIDEWLDGANHAWCPICKRNLLNTQGEVVVGRGGGSGGGEGDGRDNAAGFGLAATAGHEAV